MHQRWVIALLSAVVLSGCGSSPPKNFWVNEADFSKANVENLCEVYGMRMNRVDDAKRELVRRGTFSAYEWTLIDAKKVAPGLSECGVKAAWPLDAVAKYTFLKDRQGKPVETDMVYACNKAPAPYCPYTRVQIQNDRVTSVVQVSAL